MEEESLARVIGFRAAGHLGQSGETILDLLVQSDSQHATDNTLIYVYSKSS